MSDIILEAKNLTKEFKGFVAVNNVNLKVKRGNIHVLIGPNGAPEFDTFLPFLPVFRVCDLYESITCKHFSGNSCSLNIYS